MRLFRAPHITTLTALVLRHGLISVHSLQDDGVTRISTIQGSGVTSPLEGSSGVTIQAIVTGDFQDNDGDESRNLSGFFVQQADADTDDDPRTSEGIFVYDGDATTGTDVAVGDLVTVVGTVQERFGQTQLSAVSVTIDEKGVDLPAPTVLTFPTTSTLVDAEKSLYEPDLEAYEGMLVVVDTEMFITEMFNLDRFNEIRLFAGERPYQYTQLNTPDAAGYAFHQATLGSNRITYDDGLGVQNANIGLLDGFGPVYTTESAPRMGDTIENLAGVLDWNFNVWRIRSTADGTNTFVQSNPRPLDPPELSSNGNLKLTTFNVLNLFTTLDADGATVGPLGLDPRGANTPEEYERQITKLTTALSRMDDVDLFGLVELENDFGEDRDNPTSALTALVDAVNGALGETVYTAADPDQRYVDTGDAISVGIMYKPESLAVLGTPSILTDDGLPEGISAPVFDGENSNRAPLAVTFNVTGTGDCITVAVNHFKSKGGSGQGLDADLGDGAGNWNDRRLQAAKAVHLWLDSNPTGVVCPNRIIMGDLNAYAMEDPIQYLTTKAGYTSVKAAEEHSFVFDGQIGTLDYILVNEPLADTVTDAVVWHISEDEPDAIDYNLDFGRSPDYFDGTNPARPSDHSPVIVGFTIGDRVVAGISTVIPSMSPVVASEVQSDLSSRMPVVTASTGEPAAVAMTQAPVVSTDEIGETLSPVSSAFTDDGTPSPVVILDMQTGPPLGVPAAASTTEAPATTATETEETASPASTSDANSLFTIYICDWKLLCAALSLSYLVP